MKYKPGDKVKIKSFDWYNENKDEDGRVMCGYTGFCKEMISYCGKELTIDYIYTDSNGKQAYVMKEPKTAWRFTDGMIEELVEHQETMVSLDEVCDLLYSMLTTQDLYDYDYVTAPAYDTVEDFVEDFRKSFQK